MLLALKVILELNENSPLFDVLYIFFKCLIQSTVGSTQGKKLLNVSEKIHQGSSTAHVFEVMQLLH